MELGLRKDELTRPLGIGRSSILTGEVFLGCSLAMAAFDGACLMMVGD